MTLDELRAANPELGFAVYAMEPGGAVTFEVITPDGHTYQFTAESEAAAIALAFPEVKPAAVAAPERPALDVFE